MSSHFSSCVKPDPFLRAFTSATSGAASRPNGYKWPEPRKREAPLNGYLSAGTLIALCRSTISRDADSGKEIAQLKGHTGPVRSAGFNPDGKRVVTASDDNTARIWEADNGKEIAQLKGHTGGVLSAGFSPDGERVVTDSTARIWEADSGKETVLLKGHTDPVQSAGFSPNGKRLVTASADRTARIWDVTWATLVRGDALRERVCAEKLLGSAQEFTDAELEDPILRGIDKDDPVARNPCLRRGPLSLDYWTRLPIQFWRSLRVNVFVRRAGQAFVRWRAAKAPLSELDRLPHQVTTD